MMESYEDEQTGIGVGSLVTWAGDDHTVVWRVIWGQDGDAGIQARSGTEARRVRLDEVSVWRDPLRSKSSEPRV
jgi:hypothetical protein